MMARSTLLLAAGLWTQLSPLTDVLFCARPTRDRSLAEA